MTTTEDRVREVLSAPAYETAFEKAMTGCTDVLTEDERAAVRLAREVTRTAGPGYPAPWRLDPTRRIS